MLARRTLWCLLDCILRLDIRVRRLGRTCKAESIDRRMIVFPCHQLDLLKATTNPTWGSETKVALILINGGQIDVLWPKRASAETTRR